MPYQLAEKTVKSPERMTYLRNINPKHHVTCIFYSWLRHVSMTPFQGSINVGEFLFPMIPIVIGTIVNRWYPFRAITRIILRRWACRNIPSHCEEVCQFSKQIKERVPFLPNSYCLVPIIKHLQFHIFQIFRFKYSFLVMLCLVTNIFIIHREISSTGPTIKHPKKSLTKRLSLFI